MGLQELVQLIQHVTKLPKENEYVEFKDSNHKTDEIGKRIIIRQTK